MEIETILKVFLSFCQLEALSVHLVKGLSSSSSYYWWEVTAETSRPCICPASNQNFSSWFVSSCLNQVILWWLQYDDIPMPVRARHPSSMHFPVSPVSFYLYYFPVSPAPAPVIYYSESSWHVWQFSEHFLTFWWNKMLLAHQVPALPGPGGSHCSKEPWFLLVRTTWQTKARGAGCAGFVCKVMKCGFKPVGDCFLYSSSSKPVMDWVSLT